MHLPLDFNFLAWLRETLFFQETLETEFVRAGATFAEAFRVARSEAAKQRDIVKLYQDHGTHNLDVFNRVIEQRWNIYRGIR